MGASVSDIIRLKFPAFGHCYVLRMTSPNSCQHGRLVEVLRDGFIKILSDERVY
jgi:hypothetical protein